MIHCRYTVLFRTTFKGSNTRSYGWSKQAIADLFPYIVFRDHTIFMTLQLQSTSPQKTQIKSDIINQLLGAWEKWKVNKELYARRVWYPTSKYESIPKTLETLGPTPWGHNAWPQGSSLTVYNPLGHSIRMTNHLQNHGITLQTRWRNHRAQKVLSFCPHRNCLHFPSQIDCPSIYCCVKPVLRDVNHVDLMQLYRYSSCHWHQARCIFINSETLRHLKLNPSLLL